MAKGGKRKERKVEAFSIKVSHLPWPKFLNIHAVLANGGIDLDDKVLVLEKLDGSNLGIEIDPDRGLVAIHGRKEIMWHSGLFPEEPLNRTFGPIKDSLEVLAGDVLPCLTELAGELLAKHRSETVVFYGEWFKKSEQDLASWHPFGFALRDRKSKNNSNVFHTMTSKLHQTFVDHGLDPPRILFSEGTLFEAVAALYGRMIEPESESFEGVFITLDGATTWGTCEGACKWKTGGFEEQSRFVIKEKHLESMPPKAEQIVSMLKDVYETKAKKREPYIPKWRTGKEDLKQTDLELLKRQASLALHSTLSKSEKHISRMDEAEIESLKKAALQDVKEMLEESNDAGNTDEQESLLVLVLNDIIHEKRNGSRASVTAAATAVDNTRAS